MFNLSLTMPLRSRLLFALALFCAGPVHAGEFRYNGSTRSIEMKGHDPRRRRAGVQLAVEVSPRNRKRRTVEQPWWRIYERAGDIPGGQPARLEHRLLELLPQRLCIYLACRRDAQCRGFGGPRNPSSLWDLNSRRVSQARLPVARGAGPFENFCRCRGPERRPRQQLRKADPTLPHQVRRVLTPNRRRHQPVGVPPRLSEPRNLFGHRAPRFARIRRTEHTGTASCHQRHLCSVTTAGSPRRDPS